MEVTLEALDPKLLAQTRAHSTELHTKLQMITNDEQYHNKLLKVATFSLPEEQGKAHAQKQNMTNFYGRNPAIAGFVFSVARSVDGAEEYLGVQYVPELIVDGAWEEWQDEKAAKAAEAKARKEAREVEAKLQAELDALEEQPAAS